MCQKVRLRFHGFCRQLAGIPSISVGKAKCTACGASDRLRALNPPRVQSFCCTVLSTLQQSGTLPGQPRHVRVLSDPASHQRSIPAVRLGYAAGRWLPARRALSRGARFMGLAPPTSRAQSGGAQGAPPAPARPRRRGEARAEQSAHGLLPGQRPEPRRSTMTRRLRALGP